MTILAYWAAFSSWSLALMVEACVGTVEISFRGVDVEVADRRADVVDVETVGGQRLGFDLHPHRRTVTAADADEADAAQLRDFLGEPGFAQILKLGERQRFGRHRERHDRRVGRVDLGIDRRDRQIAGQQIVGRVDGGLNLLFGDVEAQIEAELQSDDRGAGGACRRHLVEARHLSKLPLQRRGDR